MTSYVVSRPPRRHNCDVGWRSVPITEEDRAASFAPWPPGATHRFEEVGRNDPPGTVRACEDCGRTWVAYRPTSPDRVYFCVLWRPEGRFERWRRTRREGRTNHA